MTYYRVKNKYDFKSRKYHGKNFNYVYGYFNAGELLTITEYKKIANSPFIFDVVVIPKNKTHKVYHSSLGEYKRYEYL